MVQRPTLEADHHQRRGAGRVRRGRLRCLCRQLHAGRARPRCGQHRPGGDRLALTLRAPVLRPSRRPQSGLRHFVRLRRPGASGEQLSHQPRRLAVGSEVFVMKTLLVHSYQSDGGIQLQDVPLPEPRDGEVRVRVHACGVSFVDLLLARGNYQVKPPLPFVPGSEFSGVVDALGSSAAPGLKVGDRVCGTRMGAWSEYVCLPRPLAYALLPQADFTEGSVLMASFFTALYALRERGALREAARAAGADDTVDSSSADWKDHVKALAPKGVDVVYDPVGGDATDAGFRTLGWNGRLLMIGFAGGQIGQLKTNLSIVKGAALVGVDARQFGEREPERADRVRRDVIELYAQKRIRPLVSHVLPVERFDEAAAKMDDRATFGRVVITFGAVA